MRRIASVLVALVFMAAFVLSSCSGESSSNAVPFSETVSGDGIHIWYECQNIIEKEAEDEEDPYDLSSLIDEGEEEQTGPVEYGRETKVVWIRVYKDGKLSTYSTTKNVYLGSFAKMTDEEIVKTLESDKDTFLCGQKNEPFEIYLYSDASGREIKFEGVPTIIKLAGDKSPMYFMTLISSETIPTFPVYESYYGGYVLYNYDETPFGEAVLVTRCDEGAAFGLDSLELEGAVVDYATPEDMLHEKNAELEKAGKKDKNSKTEKAAEDKADTDN